MGFPSLLEDIQDATGESKKEQPSIKETESPYLTVEEWLEEARPYLDEFEKSLSGKELLDRVDKTLISLYRQGRARPKFSRNNSRCAWKIFERKVSISK